MSNLLRLLHDYISRYFVGFIIVMILLYVAYAQLNYKNTTTVNTINEIKLTDVRIAVELEENRIIFLDRNTLQIKFILSKDVSLAITSSEQLKAQNKYNDQLKNQIPEDLKKSRVTVK